MNESWLKIKPYVKRLYALAPIDLRLGRKYWQLRKFLEAAQWWTPEEIRVWQTQHLRQILGYAYQNVPGYYQLYHEAGIKPDDLEKLEDLRYFPTVSKQLLHEHIEDFKTRSTSMGKLSYVTTGGSTGTPLCFYYTPVNRWMESAFLHTSWSWIGWKTGVKSIVLFGGRLPGKNSRWSYEATTHELTLSGYYLSEETYTWYLEKFRHERATYLRVYPSTGAILASMLLDHGDEGKPGFKIILLRSENIYPWEKELLHKAFPQARLFGFYGHSEEAVLAPWCELSDNYHAWPFYGITELLNQESQEVTQGESGEVVGTSFWNYGTPFIRYHTKDIAVKGPEVCPHCGRNFQMLERIDGRLNEMIITGSERYMPVAGFTIHSEIFAEIRQFQFYQDTPGKVVVRVIPKGSFPESSQEAFLNSLRSKLDHDTELTLEVVDEIMTTPSGKYRILEQKLPMKYGE
jgi:phenylacetate-CoA ligase